MQTKISNKTRKQIRHAHERIAASILILVTLMGMVALSDQARRVLGGLALRPAFAVMEHTSRGNETARHEVQLDSVLRGSFISGE